MERGIITITENGVVTMPTTSVWMTQQEMCDAFNVFGYDIRKAVHTIYKNGELLESETKQYIRQDNGINYDIYSLEMVIAVSFKLRSKESMTFRQFIMDKLCSFDRGNSIHLFFSLSDNHPRCTC
ncbi:transporter [Mediterranea sp. An20]|uniref:transporter n=1 Tax=Mediterranea sp. An20 TaxID=1965586 RepID=UPI000B39BE1B|nr:transporter [Mediterranea sp. An20]OUP05528.1 transporter [Mediterranea sp. An20]